MLTKRERDLYRLLFASGLAGECIFKGNIDNAEGGIKVKDSKTGKEYVVRINRA